MGNNNTYGKKIVGDIILVFVAVCDAVGSGGH